MSTQEIQQLMIDRAQKDEILYRADICELFGISDNTLSGKQFPFMIGKKYAFKSKVYTYLEIVSGTFGKIDGTKKINELYQKLTKLEIS